MLVVLDRRVDPLEVCTIGWAEEVDMYLLRLDDGDKEREGEEVEVEREEGVDMEAEVEGDRGTRCALGVPLVLYDRGRISSMSSSSSSSSSSASLPSSSPDSESLPAIALPLR